MGFVKTSMKSNQNKHLKDIVCLGVLPNSKRHVDYTYIIYFFIFHSSSRMPKYPDSVCLSYFEYVLVHIFKIKKWARK